MLGGSSLPVGLIRQARPLCPPLHGLRPLRLSFREARPVRKSCCSVVLHSTSEPCVSPIGHQSRNVITHTKSCPSLLSLLGIIVFCRYFLLFVNVISHESMFLSLAPPLSLLFCGRVLYTTCFPSAGSPWPWALTLNLSLTFFPIEHVLSCVGSLPVPFVDTKR